MSKTALLSPDQLRWEILDLKNDPSATNDVNWLLVLRAACELSKLVEPDGHFAGSWVVQRLARQPNPPKRLPGLRRLSSRRLLNKLYDTRGGNRAYYRMPQRAEIEAVLDELQVPKLSNE